MATSIEMIQLALDETFQAEVSRALYREGSRTLITTRPDVADRNAPTQAETDAIAAWDALPDTIEARRLVDIGTNAPTQVANVASIARYVSFDLEWGMAEFLAELARDVDESRTGTQATSGQILRRVREYLDAFNLR